MAEVSTLRRVLAYFLFCAYNSLINFFFARGLQDSTKPKPEKAKKAATKEEHPKTIKDRLNEAEEKKTSQPKQKLNNDKQKEPALA